MIKALLLCLATLVPAAKAGQDYIIRTIAGTSNVGDHGPATLALLVQAEGVAIDGLGNIYVADAGDNRIRKISRNGSIETIAGTGAPGSAGDGGPAISAQLHHPYGIALDLAGNIYIADLGNARVRRVSTVGLISTVAGSGSTAIPAGISIAATEAQFLSPRNVAIDNLGNLYISDFDAHQVYQVTPSGALTVFAGTGKSGFSGDGGAAKLAQISFPAGLATDIGGNVYVADSGNGRVRRIWYGAITTVAVNVPSPTGVAVDSAGHLYIASPLVAARTSASSPAGLAVDLVGAEDVASDPGGVLYLAASHNIQKLAGGLVTVIAGISSYAAYGDGGPAIAARLVGPAAIALDRIGDMYVTEQGANRIRKISSGGAISIVTGDSAELNGPTGIAVDAAGTIYVSDTGNNRIRRISAGSVLSTLADKLNAPTCLRFSLDGSLYVCDTGKDRVVKITPGGVVSVVASVPKPLGIVFGSDGTLYVSTGSQVVQISAGSISTTLVDALSNPEGLALNGTGELLIVETGKNRLLKLGAAGLITVLAGAGRANFSGDGGASSSAELNSPQDVAIDGFGNILVADTGNNRIRQLSPIASVLVPVVVAPASITVVNSASLLPGAVAPSEIVTIFGLGFDPAHTLVTFDNATAKILYAGPTQLNVLVPASIKPGAATVVNVLTNGAPAGSITLNTVASVPAIFALSNGTGQAAAQNEDGTMNSADNPQERGGVIALYITGDGQNGASISVQIGDYPADVLYAGPATGYPGLSQINARVPAGFLPSGVQPVIVTAGGVLSQPGITIVVH